jgi:hypothetical protein
MEYPPFALGPQGVTLTPTAAVSTLPLATHSGRQILIKNEGGTTAFIATGPSTVQATVNDMAVMAGTVEVFTMNPYHTHVSAIRASGTGNVYVYRSSGA